MSKTVVNPNLLRNRDKIDLLETYLGDCAHYFEWKDKGFAISYKLGKSQNSNPKEGIYRMVSIVLRIELRNYPSNEASIVVSLEGFGGYGGLPVFAEVPLSDPKGEEFINKKVKSAIFMFQNVRPE